MSSSSRVDAPNESLKRNLRVVDVVALGLNGVIGTGIFFLPGKVAELLGPASLVTFLLSAFLCTMLVLCFAEVGSRFTGTGGPMLYAQAAFGEVTGFAVGWLTWIVRVTAWGALSNGLVSAIDTLVPGAAAYRVVILIVLIAALTVINVLGVSFGARVTNVFTAAKLIPILFFIAIGVFHIDTTRFTPFAPNGFGDLAPATLIILYAFVGFEVLTIPGGEMRDPRRSIPRALVSVMSLTTVVYLLIWAVCTGTLATLAGSDNPVADAALHFMGPRGGWLIAFGIFLSVLGINAGSALVAPRSLFALAHAGYLPRGLAWVHPRARTPVVAIMISSGITLAVAISGSFVELAVISVVARFAQYIPTCIAVLYFRWKRPDDTTPFRLPMGPVIPVLSVAICGWLLSQAEPRRLLWGLVALVAGLLLYGVARLSRSIRNAQS